MALHCCVRLGVATWLYQNRQEIAYALGMVDEPPMTICSHAHDLDRALTFTVSTGDQDEAPASIFQASEINLFLQFALVEQSPRYTLLRESPLSGHLISKYPSPALRIFHPPA